MKLSRVYARFYKSFNFDNVRKVAGKKPRGEWEMIGNLLYPFVEIPLDERITAVVGANESGKSHLLGAIERGITGKKFTERDLCRYCDFFGVEAGEKQWPHIGLDWNQLTAAESETLAAILDLGKARPRSFLMFRYGPDVLHVWLDAGQGLRQFVLDEDLNASERLTRLLPQPLIIDPNIALPGAVPIRWLADPNKASPSIGDRRQRFSLLDAARQLTSLVGGAADTIVSNAGTLHGILWPIAQHGLAAPSELNREQLRLTQSLLFDMANIDRDSFRVLAEAVADSHDGFANALIEKLNEQIERSLNFRRWWVQDRDFSLRISAREHEVVFTIRDRTGTEYTFDERSSGLKYFLSYLIQSQAGRAAGGDRILLMDEPDAHLSAEAQQDLLRIFSDLAEPMTRDRPPIQVIYVTHSPFLLDKNHADRIRVLEKGRSLDGTRVIAGGAHNHYEPLRSAFGAFVGETAFVGAVNLLVEGSADQILLAGAARAIRDEGAEASADTLDLNRMVIVPCGAASQVPFMAYLIRGRGDSERPAVVALLDSDKAGREAAEVMKTEKKFKKLLQPEFVLQLGELDLGQTGAAGAVEELEDLIPPALAVEAVNRGLAAVFRFRDGEAPVLVATDLTGPGEGGLFDRLEAALETKGAAIGKVPFARAVVDLLNDEALPKELKTARAAYLSNMKALFRQLNEARRDAEDQSKRIRNSSLVSDRVRMFELDHPHSASHEEVDQLLGAISKQIDESNEADAIRLRMQELRTEYRLRDDPGAAVQTFSALMEQLKALKDAPAVIKLRVEAAADAKVKSSPGAKVKPQAKSKASTKAEAPAGARSKVTAKPTPHRARVRGGMRSAEHSASPAEPGADQVPGETTG